MEEILTYVYYKWEECFGTKAPDEKKYMENLHKLVENGYFQYVNYVGQFMTGAIKNEFGIHYGITFIANKEITKEILDLIEYDHSEFFIIETMEKVSKKDDFTSFYKLV